MSCDRVLTLKDAVAIVGDEAVRKLYAAGFVVIDRLEWRDRNGVVCAVRRSDVLRAASRVTGLPLGEIGRLIDGTPAIPGVEAGGAHVDVVSGCGGAVVAAEGFDVVGGVGDLE